MLEETVASFCLSQTLILLTRPTPTPASPPCRLLFPESHPRACQITFFIASRQKAIWSSWSPLSVGLGSQALLPGPPTHRHRLRVTPRWLPLFIFHPLPPPPPQPQCLSPWAPLPCLGRNNVGCQLALSMQGKRHNFSRLKAYRFFICFSQPGVSPLMANILILGLSYSSSFFLALNLNSMLGKSLCKDRKPRTQHESPPLLASSSLAGEQNCTYWG